MCQKLFTRVPCGPILMKLWGYIELILNWCNVKFPTSVAGPKPEVGQFFENHKFQSSKPEVEKYLIGKPVGFYSESLLFVFLFLDPGSHHDHFCPGMSRIKSIYPQSFIKIGP